MTEVVQTLDSEQIREGLFIPLELFAGHDGIEIKVTDDGVVTIRPRERRLSDVWRTIDSRREALKHSHGLMDDSTNLIREDRDNG